MNLGEKISSLRKQSNMTQFDLAERLNVSNKMISKWETNRCLPDVETIKRIADVFNVSITELFDSIKEKDIEEKKYDFNTIYKFKKYCFISFGLIVVASFFTLLYATKMRNLIYRIPSDSIWILDIICITSVFLSLLISVIMFTNQVIFMKEVCKKNPTVIEYNKAFKTYCIIFGIMVSVATISILSFFICYGIKIS